MAAKGSVSPDPTKIFKPYVFYGDPMPIREKFGLINVGSGSVTGKF